jgi:GT2 family glycosyltransferase
MEQQSYFKCSFFQETLKHNTKFSVFQDEIRLENLLHDGKVSFKKETIEYKCSYEEKIKLSSDKPVGIIPIKDNINLLKFTLNNLFKNNVFKYVDFIIVDDRSSTDIKNVCLEYPINYLRIENNKGFNFSMLNNIAAKIAFNHGVKEIILWNSDLWVPDSETISKLIKKHNEEESIITGTKLIYPVFSWDGKEVSHNIQTIFPNKSKDYRGTIQFGGSSFILSEEFKTYFPIHSYRFREKDYYKSNIDKLSEFVTGAFQIINLKWFIDTGGLNPSLSKNFQDVDICLRASEENKKVMYFGKDLFLFHDESVSLSNNKNDNQFVSDNVLYSKIWNNQRFFKTVIL